jgi:hypothetical protein
MAHQIGRGLVCPGGSDVGILHLLFTGEMRKIHDFLLTIDGIRLTLCVIAASVLISFATAALILFLAAGGPLPLLVHEPVRLVRRHPVRNLKKGNQPP